MKILILSCDTRSLFWFRMDMMNTFASKGIDVIVTGDQEGEQLVEKFKSNNIKYISIPGNRNKLNVLTDLRTFKAIKKIIKNEKPDKIFVYLAKTIVYGSLAAHFTDKNIEIYPLVGGLGSIFRGSGFKMSILKKILSLQYELAFKYAKKIIFQNNDDLNTLIKLSKVDPKKTSIINGSGVNVSLFQLEPLPEKKSVLFIGRLIRDKGIREYLKVCKKIKGIDSTIDCLLVGPYDTNPSAISEEELKPYIDAGIIKYFGEQKDVRPFIKQCTVFVLPSYHEGTPKVVLEAMAIGRPIVTTDAPGCRETVIDGKNGFLVPIKDVNALETAISTILNNKNLAEKMATESRKIAETKYDINIVNNQIMKIMNI